jgi:hypothetical protein
MNDADPIDLVRAARHTLSERLHHDPAKVVEHYLALQQEYRGRLLEAPENRREDAKEGAARGGRER